MTMFHRKSDRVTTAILLAAGTGSRLQPLTNDAPKCLTEVNGTTILERLVQSLRQQGFRRLVVVIGHLGECIREFLADHAGGLTVDYVTSSRYRTTNNLYSLWLARKEIREPFLLVECDLVFDAFLLGDMLLPDKIAVARVQPWMIGSTVGLDPSQQITDFRVGHSEVPDDSRYKTVNIYSFSLPSWRRVTKRLDRHVSAGKVNDYYEAVFAEMVADGSLCFEPVFFDDGRWYEVDTLANMHEAERMFSKHPDGILLRDHLTTSKIRTFHRTPKSRTNTVALVRAVPKSRREKTN